MSDHSDSSPKAVPPFQLPSLMFQPRRYRYAGVSDWSGHIPFARDLIAAKRPSLFVELGAHYGESYFAFCQSIEDENSASCAVAIDTWRGDDQTGDYGEAVFQDVNAHNVEHYGHFSTLLRMRFDEGLSRFEDRSIDLLHIDGLHTYDAVRHDWECWYPKLAPGAIVLLHDIAVHRGDFGVFAFWKELSDRFSTFEFQHSCGLGVVEIPGASPRNGILQLLFDAPHAPADHVRRYYEACADAMEMRSLRTKGPHWEIVSQLYWKPDGEAFSEPRSSRASLVLTTSPSTVELTIVPSPDLSHIRLDLVNRKTALRLIGIAILAGGAIVEQLSGDEFLSKALHSDLEWLPGGAEGALVLAYGADPSAVLEIDRAKYPAYVTDLTVRFTLRGVPTETAVEQFLHACPKPDAVVRAEILPGHETELREYARALVDAQGIAEQRGGEPARYNAALGEAQRVAAEGQTELHQNAGALANAQQLAEQYRLEAVRYNTALAEAQRIAGDQQAELRRYGRALAEAQQVAEQHRLESVRYNTALGEAQKIASDREAELHQYVHALAQAQQAAEQHRLESVRYAAALEEARRELDVQASGKRDLEAQLLQLKAARDQVQRELDLARQELQAIQATRIWRIANRFSHKRR